MENEVSLAHPLIKKLLEVGLICISCEIASLCNAKSIFHTQSFFSKPRVYVSQYRMPDFPL